MYNKLKYFSLITLGNFKCHLSGEEGVKFQIRQFFNKSKDFFSFETNQVSLEKRLWGAGIIASFITFLTRSTYEAKAESNRSHFYQHLSIWSRTSKNQLCFFKKNLKPYLENFWIGTRFFPTAIHCDPIVPSQKLKYLAPNVRGPLMSANNPVWLNSNSLSHNESWEKLGPKIVDQVGTAGSPSPGSLGVIAWPHFWSTLKLRQPRHLGVATPRES